MKRIALLILTNIAVVVMLGIILTVVSMLTGINFGQMAGKSLNVGALFVFALVVGFAGSIISLFMSKSMAKMSMGVQLINTDNPSPGLEQWLVGVVRAQADKLGLQMPEVGIYEGEPNAFATGASKNSSLVAVSTGLLSMMNQKEVEAVLAHEMSHVANGDMVTMTLIQGVTNTFVVFLSRLIGWVVDRQILRNEDDAPGIGYYVTSIVLDIAFGLLAGIIVAAFSRYREFRADAGAAQACSLPNCLRPSRVSVSRAALAASLPRILPSRIASQLCATAANIVYRTVRSSSGPLNIAKGVLDLFQAPFLH